SVSCATARTKNSPEIPFGNKNLSRSRTPYVSHLPRHSGLQNKLSVTQLAAKHSISPSIGSFDRLALQLVPTVARGTGGTFEVLELPGRRRDCDRPHQRGSRLARIHVDGRQ
ncbi:hypothetical protein GWI33_000673, partial [Rhynchophorus ferrugineus]